MRRLVAAGLLLLAAGPLRAQEAAAPPLRVSSAVAPETVTVGDRFRSVLQVVAPPGARVDFSPLAIGDSLQPADSLRVIPGRGGEPPIASYSLVAWVAGAPLSARVPVRVVLADGSAATYLVPLRLPVVASMLPADTAGLEPRPARGEIPVGGGARPLWPWIAAAAVALALLAAGARLLLARRGTGRSEEPISPRERALAALERAAAAAGPPEEAVYPPASRALRAYLAELDARWGVDLTTRELLERLRTGGVPEEPREVLRVLLQHADRVKFARYAPRREEVEGFLSAARRWVAAFPPERPAGSAAREAA